MAPRDELAEELVDRTHEIPYSCPNCGNDVRPGEKVYAYQLQSSGDLGETLCSEHNPMYPTDRAVVGDIEIRMGRLIVVQATALDTSDPSQIYGTTVVTEDF